ncbi:MAG: DUF6502 family protein [Burkholderiales bacterium]
MAEQKSSNALVAAFSRILRALARVALRHGFSCKSSIDLLKQAYVDVAATEFGVSGRKSSMSRVAVLTGLTRKDIQHLMSTAAITNGQGEERYNRAARVVAGWVRDAAYADAAGEPRILPIDDGTPSFAELVRRHSGDMPPRAVLDELLRVGVVERMEDGRVRLLARAYVPATSDADKLVILGIDVAALINTIDHNLGHPGGEARFQRKVMYDNLPVEAMPAIRAVSGERAQALLEYLDRTLSEQDRDVNPAIAGTGRMCAGVGIFYFEHPAVEDAGKDH